VQSATVFNWTVVAVLPSASVCLRIFRKVVLIGMEDSHTGVSLIEPTAFLENPPRSIPRLSSEVSITIQVNELKNGAASVIAFD
jgi:hypothetical protein